MIKKENEQFLCSVEGETEEWYFHYLQKIINDRLNQLNANFTISILPKKCSPKKFMKTYPKLSSSTMCFHVFDYDNDKNRFITILDEMHDAKKQKGIQYKMGYTNLSFELWMILHKINFNKSLLYPANYLAHLKRAFDTSIVSIDDYKKEKKFKDILNEITLENVYSAINRAEKIQQNRENVSTPNWQNGYKWYLDNPSLSIHECIKKIMDFCLTKLNNQIKDENKILKKKGQSERPLLQKL